MASGEGKTEEDVAGSGSSSDVPQLRFKGKVSEGIVRFYCDGVVDSHVGGTYDSHRQMNSRSAGDIINASSIPPSRPTHHQVSHTPPAHQSIHQPTSYP